MERLGRARIAAVMTVVALLTLALAAPGTSVEQRPTTGSLSVSPNRNYVGGQALTFSGDLGASGVRTIKLQANLGRSGDGWEPVDGFSGRTDAKGAFSFVFRAPGMKGVSYRVVSGSLVTQAVVFNALSQDLTLEPISEPVAGVPFVIEVDTTPSLVRRPDVIGLQAIPGRTLTLQRRVSGDTWQKVGQEVVENDGTALFTVTEQQAGTVVYRARQEDWTSGGNAIGWFPSFPTYVEVFATGGERAAAPRAAAPAQCVTFPTGDKAGPTAGGTNKWGASLFDFAWVAGESLTSKPYRGTRKAGQWVDYTDGGGRVNKNNGGLMLDSKRDNACGSGDFGTTRATLQGNPQTYGRWEVRLRLKSDEKGARDYRTVVELVPERAADYDCGAHNVTIAEMTPHANQFSFGVNAVTKKWSATRTNVPINNAPQNFAVEVSKKHMTWFFQGKPVGTVKSAAASSDVPMTLRLSMEGDGDTEMNHTELISDWQRGFTLKSGSFVTNGKALKQGSYSAPAC